MIDKIVLTSAAGRGSVTMTRNDRRGYWLEDVDWGQAEGQHNAYSYYNQIGESIVSTAIGPRAVAITGFIVENQGTMRERCDFLNAFLSPVEDYTLAYGGKVIRIRPDRSVIYSREYLTNNRKLRKFLIQATAPYPLFSGEDESVAAFDELQKLFRFPTALGSGAPLVFGLTSKVYHTTIDNTGGFAAGMVIEIAFAGTVTNPRVRNLTTGGMIGVDRTFAAGERLRISTLPGEKSITLIASDGTASSLMKYRNYETVWIRLQPGENLISVEADDLAQRGNMTATVRWTPLYLEVE